MMIKLYKFSKKENSTKQPPVTPAPFGVTAVIKDTTDVLHPVFELTDYNWLNDYNYLECTWYGAKRYYFIDTITTETNTICYLHCMIDVGATWKGAIESSTQYIERCSDPLVYTTYSPLLNDVAAPAVIGSVTASIDTWNIFDTTGGFYVLGINGGGITKPLTKRGSVSYVIMSKADIDNFINDLFQLVGTPGDLSPIQYIASCVYIPFTYNASEFTQQTDNNINLGTSGYTMDLSYHYYTAASQNQTNGLLYLGLNSVTIPDHLQAASHGAFMNYEPYSKVHVVGGPFGDFDLPINMLPRKLSYRILIDQTDGSGVFEVANSGHTLTYLRVSAQVGVPIGLAQSVAQTTSDKYKVGMSLISSLGSAISFNIGQSIAGFGTAVQNAHEGNIPKVSSSGSNGSLAALGPIITLSITNDVLEDDSCVGKPIFKNLTISTIASGSFVKCRNPEIEIDGLMEEERLVTELLRNGFFYET